MSKILVPGNPRPLAIELVDKKLFANCIVPIDKIIPSLLESALRPRAWSAPRFNEHAQPINSILGKLPE